LEKRQEWEVAKGPLNLIFSRIDTEGVAKITLSSRLIVGKMMATSASRSR
jgi:hypothetical protein